MKRNLHILKSIQVLLLTLLLLLGSVASQAQEEINVVGGIRTILSGDLTPSLLDRTDFDFALVGGGRVVHTFIIQNLGTSALTVSSITGTGDFATIGVLTPASPILAGRSSTFTVTFIPSVVGLRTGTITINNSDADEGVYTFAVQGIGASSGISSWDPLLYPPSACSWTAQDNNSSNSPYASWNLVVSAAQTAGTNKIITLQPDAYVGSYNYDGANGNESCLGHQVSATMNLTSAQNGMQILGSAGGCKTFIDLSSGSSTDQWGNFTGMNGLTIKNIYLRQWGGAINLSNCSNVLIEDCVFENSNKSAVNAVIMSGCTNVTFRRCKFLGNVNNSGRALNITNSGIIGTRVLLEDCEFGCNANGGSGAALQVGAGSFVRVNGGTFAGNAVGGGGRGGAVNILVGANVEFLNVRFIGNSVAPSNATDGGGAIFVDGVSTTTQTTVLIDGCNFYQNRAAGTLGRGGAVACHGSSTDVSKSLTTIRNSIFENNGADRGGAVLALNATVVINNNFFQSNKAADLTTANDQGGALSYQNAAGNYALTNNTFLDNLSASGQIGRNNTGCGGCFSSISGNNYNSQTQVNLANTAPTTGWSLTPSSLSSIAAGFSCSSGSYCSTTSPGACLSATLSNYICAPAAGVSGSISGQVWDDADGNGIQAPTDLGIANVFVLLYDEMGYVIGRTTTNSSGFYTFSGLPEGNYQVVFVNPSPTNYPFVSPANAPGSTESTDSDQAFTTIIGSDLRGATSPFIILAAGANVVDVDLGLSNIDLPVELMFFAAKRKNCQTNLLTWATASEFNNKAFEIERSVNGIEFRTIGLVAGSGTSSTIHHYEWEDPAILRKAYYRLKQVDWDGTTTYSNLAYVENNCSSTNNFAYPNPVQDQLKIQLELFEAKSVKIVLINSLGQLVYNQNIHVAEGISAYEISTENLPTGNYILRVLAEQETLLLTKVVVQH